jgi:AhpD family alkylhydroperoxidase
MDARGRACLAYLPYRIHTTQYPEGVTMQEQRRNAIYREIEQQVGFVPAFFEELPDKALDSEWKLFSQQLDEDYGAIPPKYRELVGLAVAASEQCPYCIYAHTQFARLFGASDEEIEDAAHTGKHTAGWSTYLAGLGTDLEEFKSEVDQVVENMKENK